MRRLAWAVAAVLVAALAVGVSACGGGGGNGGGGGGGGKQGGSIKIGTVGPDSYDPVLMQTVQAFQPLKTVYTGLLAYKDAYGKAGNELVPGLAEKMPDVSSDGKTYTFQLRKNLKYGDGTPVKASDFEVAIKRLFKLAGPYSSFLSTIKGTDAWAKKGDVKAPIPGIQADDKTGKIVVHLTTPDSKFQYAMAEPYTAPVPGSKVKYSSMTNDPPPGVGPYDIKVVDPSREFILTRNKYFNIPTINKGKLDKITGLVSTNVTKMTEDVINGKLDFMTEDPTGDLLPTVKAKYKDRFSLNPYPPNVYYISMNNSIPPFNNVKAREAVNYAIDSRALQRVFGGRLQPGCTFLPPAYAGIGYEKPTCKWGDPNGPGNIAKAKQLVKESGTAGQSVTMWTNNKDPRPAIGEYIRDMLNSIGYKATVKPISPNIFFTYAQNTKNKVQINVQQWYQDYPAASDFLYILFGCESFHPGSDSSINIAGFCDPTIDAQMQDALKTEQTSMDEANKKWAAVDKAVMTAAPTAPIFTPKLIDFTSKRVGNYQFSKQFYMLVSQLWVQ
jgi:peptide/nickel transport system substrate-binding protein